MKNILKIGFVLCVFLAFSRYLAAGSDEEIRHIARRYLNAVCKRDAKGVMFCLSNRARQEDLVEIIGTSNPHYCAFEIKSVEQIDKDRAIVVYKIYSTYTGYPEVWVSESSLTVRHIGDRWLIDAVC